ncbi:MAG: hypothetical protein Tsb002_05520 [Wenzhouxiangellaceae bacterium]
MDPLIEIKGNDSGKALWWERVGNKYGRNLSVLQCIKKIYYPTYDEKSSSTEELKNCQPTKPAGEGYSDLRVQFAHELFPIIDEYHENFKAELRMSFVSTNFFFDLAVLGLNAAGTVVGGEGMKAALAATAAGLGGTKLAISEHYFQEQTLTAITNQIDAQRAHRKALILTKLQETDYAKYPLSAVESDMLLYFYSASLVNAFGAIEESAGEAKKEQEAGLERVEVKSLGHYIDSGVRGCLGQWLNDDANYKALEEWLKKRKIDYGVAGLWPYSSLVDESLVQAAASAHGVGSDCAGGDKSKAKGLPKSSEKDDGMPMAEDV